MNLPAFKYHRSPVQSGSVEESDKGCKCCGEIRGYIYVGPVYSETDLEESICPWCIGDGAAHQKFNATFVDEEALPDELPESVVQALSQRTPGYDSWQPERWFACCGDAMTYLEPAGIREIRERYREAEFVVLNSIIYDLHISGAASTRMLESLNRDSGPTAHIFQCSHCSAYRTFIDGVFDMEDK
jgi:uncharacterized protein CbrC (UPF0167 family)